jgi:hypothetical protein
MYQSNEIIFPFTEEKGGSETHLLIPFFSLGQKGGFVFMPISLKRTWTSNWSRIRVPLLLVKMHVSPHVYRVLEVTTTLLYEINSTSNPLTP